MSGETTVYSYDHESPRGAPAAREVWIVDDDRSIRWVLEKALAREGIEFRSFSSAFEVLQALNVSTPQVLVSDKLTDTRLQSRVMAWLSIVNRRVSRPPPVSPRSRAWRPILFRHATNG